MNEMRRGRGRGMWGVLSTGQGEGEWKRRGKGKRIKRGDGQIYF